MAYNVSFNTVKLVVGGSIVGNNKAAGALTTSNANYTFGSSTDLWGTTLTWDQVNASNFGVVVNFVGTGNPENNYTTKLIKATNFGFSLPIGAVVRGVIATVKGRKREDVLEALLLNTYADVDYISLQVHYDLPAEMPPDL